MNVMQAIARHIEAWLCGVGILYLLQLCGIIGAIALPAAQ